MSSPVPVLPRPLPVLALCLTAMLAACGTLSRDQGNPELVKRQGSKLMVRGKEFRFVGTNNYYLAYQSQAMADDVLKTAADHRFTVMRTWGFLDIADPASTGDDGPKNGVYFQSFKTNPPTVNEGPTGLERLDYVVAEAGKRGLKLVIPLTNNWSDFGGMDAYVRARGLKNHDAFYTDATIRTWFKAYVTTLLNHKNKYTGVAYKDDPTIMMWELANEPRCGGSGALPASSACTTETITAWADDMSSFIRRFDPHHLIGTGDEGFLCDRASSDYMYNCGAGVDGAALASLKNIDVVSLHLYPDHWGKTTDWGTQWIRDHLALARSSNKAFFLGEFGLQNKDTRDQVYTTWTDAVRQGGGSGSLYWILSGKMDDGTSYYPDYDGFTVYCPSSTCTAMTSQARQMQGLAPVAAPLAANDTVPSVAAGSTVTLDVLANDRASAGETLRPDTLDLDATAPGIQTTKPVREGSFTVVDGRVSFRSNGLSAPAALTLAYTVQDTGGETSNRAQISMTITGGSNSLPAQLFSFEDGTQGWGPINGATKGTVEQTTAFATEGTHGLLIHSIGGDWFGTDASSGVFPLAGKSTLKFDLQTLSSGTSYAVALKVGDAWTWCQGGFTWVQPGTTAAVSVDLSQYSCAGDFTQVRSMYVFVGAGDFHIDNVRAE